MDYYKKFQEKNKEALYTIFKCSWIFERDIKSRFNSVISVYATKDERALRYRLEKNISLQETYNIFKSEITDLKKNVSSNYVIHSYEGGAEIFSQVNKIDQKIAEYILNKKEIQHD
jgi:dephospho-CoA kinase